MKLIKYLYSYTGRPEDIIEGFCGLEYAAGLYPELSNTEAIQKFLDENYGKIVDIDLENFYGIDV